MATSRRQILQLAACLPILAGCQTAYPFQQQQVVPFPAIEKMEAESEGRFGVAAMNLESGHIIAHRGHERFAMCSTFKWLLAAAILHRVDAGTEKLDRLVPISAGDLVSWSPVTEKRVQTGMTVGELCSATVSISDNAAANLLLAIMDGPAGFTQFIRTLGDDVTRLDRWETELNNFAPNDPRDTTSPLSMLHLMKTILFGTVLSKGSLVLLKTWMHDANTGLQRLRAGIPETWYAGDKTGTNGVDHANDVAFAIPPAGSDQVGPFLIISYLNTGITQMPVLNSIHAEIARTALAEMTN